MNGVQIFDNAEFGRIRTVTVDGEPWFVGIDVARALEYRNGSRDVERHTYSEDRMKTPVFDGLKNKDTILINESGLYSLIFSSKMEKAKQFKHWVTSEVLPCLRKYGQFQIEPTEGILVDGESLPERQLTIDDYFRAAALIANCKNERLPYVFSLLEKVGIDMPATENTKKAKLEKQVAAVNAMQTARANHGITFKALGEMLGISRNRAWEFVNGQKKPSPEKADFIVAMLKQRGLIE